MNSRRFICLLVAVTALVYGGWASPGAGSTTRVARASTSTISPRLFAAGLEAQGRVVRTDVGVTVELINLPPQLRADAPGVDRVWRVTVRGNFPPRALPYSILAGSRLIGEGVPSADQRAVRSVTTDPAVLSDRVTVRYGDQPAPEDRAPTPSIPSSALAPAGIPNPREPGTYEVSMDLYDLGDKAFEPSKINRKVELAGNVHYPTDLSGGPYPLVLFMHGNHSTCYKERQTRYEWPCREGWLPLPNYAGYDYISRRLASHGYVVVSISANGVNVHGNRARFTGMRQRGEVVDKHVDLWRDWSTTGGAPFGDKFVGSIDLTRIGTMGHSRGGEGVVWHKIVDDSRPDPYGVDAVLALAPVDFSRVKINEATFAVLLPYCDGDVSDLQGVHFFDDSRYAVPGDPTPKHSVTMFDANHNFFNTVWTPSHGYPGGFDDGRWSDCDKESRLSPRQQRRVGRSYIVGFFRRYIGEETEFDPMWTGAVSAPFIEPASALVSYLAPDLPDRRMDITRYTSTRDLSRTRAGGRVTTSDLSLYSWCANEDGIPCVPRFEWVDIHRPGLGEGVIGWSDKKGRVRFGLLESTDDVSDFDAFQFRVVPNPGYFANERYAFQDLVVRLVDRNGNFSEVAASEVDNAALAYPLTGRRRTNGHMILNQLRFPLKRFQGVNLNNLRAVILLFTAKRQGVINIADAAFSAGAG